MTHIVVFTPSSPVVASFSEYVMPKNRQLQNPAQGAIKPLLIATDTRIVRKNKTIFDEGMRVRHQIQRQVRKMS